MAQVEDNANRNKLIVLMAESILSVVVADKDRQSQSNIRHDGGQALPLDCTA